MLLRMLSACAPCIGYWINPTAYSGQDQDPSDETIVESDQEHKRFGVVWIGACSKACIHVVHLYLLSGCADAWTSFMQALVQISLPSTWSIPPHHNKQTPGGLTSRHSRHTRWKYEFATTVPLMMNENIGLSDGGTYVATTKHCTPLLAISLLNNPNEKGGACQTQRETNSFEDLSLWHSLPKSGSFALGS